MVKFWLSTNIPQTDYFIRGFGSINADEKGNRTGKKQQQTLHVDLNDVFLWDVLLQIIPINVSSCLKAVAHVWSKLFV